MSWNELLIVKLCMCSMSRTLNIFAHLPSCSAEAVEVTYPNGKSYMLPVSNTEVMQSLVMNEFLKTTFLNVPQGSHFLKGIMLPLSGN